MSACLAELCPYWPGEGCLRAVMPCPITPEHAASDPGKLAGYGSCWCCAQYGIVTPAVSTVGLCRPCGSRSPSACRNAHQKDAGDQAPASGAAGHE